MIFMVLERILRQSPFLEYYFGFKNKIKRRLGKMDLKCFLFNFIKR